MIQAWTNTRFQSVKQNYLAKSPLEKWRFVRQINYYLFKLIGVDFMEKSYKVNIVTSIPILLVLNYYVLLIYTWYYYRHNLYRALISSPALGTFIPCTILLLIILEPLTREQLRRLYNFGADFIYAKHDISSKNHDACNNMAIYLITCSIRVNLLILLSYALAVGAPIYKTLFTDENEMILPVILPFIDPDTQNGFNINYAYQVVICIFGGFIVPGCELVTCVLKNNVSVIAAVITNALTEFETQLGKNNGTAEHIDAEFRNILLKILDFDRYVVDFCELFYWKYFLQPLILMYAITVSIFSYLMINWITGIGYSACCYIQLLVVCDAGKSVDDAVNGNLHQFQSNSVMEAINRFKFYLLPSKKQEMFALILNRMQNGAKVQMGPFRKLDYEAATQLTKTIYTYLMLMLKARK